MMFKHNLLRSTMALIACAIIQTCHLAATNAATRYWDNDGSGVPAGGTGNWNTSSSFWSTSPTVGSYTTWNNLGNDTAVLGGTAGTVTLTENITVGGLRFDTANTIYTIDTNANTLSFNAANNFIGYSRVSAATITGAVGGSGNVSVGLVNPYDGSTLRQFTLNLNGTSAGGWSGSTTVGALTTLSLSQSNQALLNTSAITLNGGAITLTNVSANAGGSGANRVNNSAAITANGGTITMANAAGSGIVYSETLGSVGLTSGQTNFSLATNQNGGGGNNQTLTLSGLTRTGASNTSAISFGSANGLNISTNIINVTGASGTGTSSGQIIGPWAFYGTTPASPTDYAVYDASGRVLNASIGATAENTWAGGTNVTLNAPTTLTATRTINSLRYTGGSGALNLGASNFNLETYGLLNGGSGLTISTTGTGGLTTPSGGGNLYLTTGAGAITVSAPITDNSGVVTVVKNGSNTLTLSGTNLFTGSVVLNGGTLVAAANANLGSGSAPLIVNSSSTFTGSSTTYARGIQLNNGAILTNGNNANPIFSGDVSGTGGLAITNGFGSQVTLSGTGNTFEGPLLISGAGTGGQAYRFSVASLADSTTANGRIVFSVSSVSHGNGSVFVYTGSSDLTLNNRVIEIASTGATPVNGHQIRRDGSGTITINTDLLVNSTTAQTLSLGGTNTTGVNTFDGAISNGASSAISLTKVDAGTWVLSGTNIYTGNTTISAGILEVGGSGSLGAGNYAGTISIANVSGGTLRVNSTASQILGGVISGAGALVKGNSGVLTLTNANLYTGATTVNAGTLLVNGSTAVGSAFTVGGALASGTPTLGGTGTIGGTVNIAEASGGVAGTLSPGASIESLASGALTMGTGSTFVFESLNNASTGADLMVVNGGLSLTSVNLDLTGANLADPGWAVNDKLTLISYTGSTITSGFVGFANNSLHTFGLNEWRFLYDDSTPGSNYFSEATGSQFVTMELITVVPEPSSLAMLAFGLISLWLFRKRQ